MKIASPNKKAWTRIPVNNAGTTYITLENGDAYVGFYIGTSGKRDILLILVGNTGNTTCDSMFNSSELSVTTGTAQLNITTNVSNMRYLYLMPLIGNKPVEYHVN